MEVYFVLDERGEPRREKDLEAWSQWFQRADRGVARAVVTPEVTVLTTFRGLDDAAAKAPLLFQTHVFGGVLDGEEILHRTRAEALAGHAVLAEWCRIGNAPDHGLTEEDIT